MRDSYKKCFLKGEDNNYYASATIFQEFKAWDAEGNLVIKDIDKKTIKLVLFFHI